jgi:hypothetical protein
MYNILYVTDNLGNVRYWIGGGPFFGKGSTVPALNAAVVISDLVYDRLAKGGYVSEMIFDNFHLLKANAADIPDSVNDAESLKAWYLQTTGDELMGVTENPHIAWHSKSYSDSAGS